MRNVFRPRGRDALDLPRPIFLTVGRVAVEKNLEAFLKLDLPGTKLVVGDGPARAALAKAYPDAVFLGARHGEALAEIYAAADVFVFPSRTDTFGLVLLEALASGVPVAAFPAAAPRDVIGEAPVGALDEDLAARLPRSAGMLARGLPRLRAAHDLGGQRADFPRACAEGARAWRGKSPHGGRRRCLARSQRRIAGA